MIIKDKKKNSSILNLVDRLKWFIDWISFKEIKNLKRLQPIRKSSLSQNRYLDANKQNKGWNILN